MMKWRTCKAFPEYAVREDGVVKRIVPRQPKGGGVGKIMKPYRREDGYNMYILREGNKSYHKKAHQLVIEEFVGPKPFPKAEVCHNDGTRHNDHYTNLRWDTRKNNHADKRKHGTQTRGESHPFSRLTESDIRIIRRLGQEKVPHGLIGVYFGMGQGSVSRIIRKERWAHVE